MNTGNSVYDEQKAIECGESIVKLLRRKYKKKLLRYLLNKIPDLTSLVLKNPFDPSVRKTVIDATKDPYSQKCIRIAKLTLTNPIEVMEMVLNG